MWGVVGYMSVTTPLERCRLTAVYIDVGDIGYMYVTTPLERCQLTVVDVGVVGSMSVIPCSHLAPEKDRVPPGPRPRPSD